MQLAERFRKGQDAQIIKVKSSVNTARGHEYTLLVTSQSIIRTARADDAIRIVELSEQLGYLVDVAQVESLLIPSASSSVLVSETDGFVSGYCEAQIQSAIESGRRAVITGLVIDHRYRRKGVGRELVQAAIAWASQQGVSALRVRTNVVREDAQAFYEQLGFTQRKQQVVYDLSIGE